MRVLVTGGAGYVGSHSAKLLAESGHDVTVVDNLAEGHRAAVGKLPLVVADLLDRERITALIRDKRIEAVMHFAAFAYVGVSVTEPAKYYHNNIVGTLALLDSMREAGVDRIVFSSTCATYGNPQRIPITEDHPQNPISPYGFTKLAIEHALADYSRAYNLGYAALRYFNASGAAADGTIGEDHDPETHLIPLVLQVALGQRPHAEIFGTDYPTPDGTCVRDYIHVDDLATAHLAALENLKPGNELKLNLGTGQGASVKQVIDRCREVTGHPIPTREGPRRPGDPPELVADPSAAKRALGWEAKHKDVRTIIESAWRWHSKHPNGYRD
ncbi:MAG TPA: UDP-glucose 4-epimerase GalE [Lacipirellulaceae bacterium]|jgi:UDP-glucose-4-epimerase GalE|nr:UDP-glucose 4-epimerase GalE [Lacipirellulaceae bacterium]